MSIQLPSKARKSLTKLALTVAGLAAIFALQAPRPAFALTCEQQCAADHNACLNSCYRICSEAECYDICWGQCDADNFYCLSQC